MNDPWHDETLEELVVYLQAARMGEGTAWALVVTTSGALAHEVLAELRRRVGDIEQLEVPHSVDPRPMLDEWLGRRTDTITGLRLEAALASEHSGALLTWLNFRREQLERPGCALVFALSHEHLGAWLEQAPDLNRYTQHFEFIDWEDLLAAAEASAAATDDTIISVKQELDDAERPVATLRTLGDHRVLVQQLLFIAEMAIQVGNWDRAWSATNEVLALTETTRGPGHLSGLTSRAVLLDHEGHPDRAIREIENLDPEFAPYSSLYLALFRSFTGQSRWALRKTEQWLTKLEGDNLLIGHGNAGSIEHWLGRITSVGRRVHLASQLPRGSRGRFSHIYLLKSIHLHAVGQPYDSLEPMARALGLSTSANLESTIVVTLIHMAAFTLDLGCPQRSIEYLSRVSASPYARSARVFGLAPCRAEALQILGGPAAVGTVIADEEARQEGWSAPIPAAELAYVRGLAAMTNNEARRHLQHAADRYRTMDGIYYLGEVERHLARLDRLDGDYDRAVARIDEGLEWHAREGARPKEARDRTERSLIALGRGDAESALREARKALELVHACGTHMYEPAALVALAEAERALGRDAASDAHDARWRKLVEGIGAHGLRADLERDSTWARQVVG